MVNVLSVWARKPDDVYVLLYESLLSWFAGRRAASAHCHLYAVATLAVVAFINISSVVVLCAYLGFAWARELFLVGRLWLSSVVLAVALLVAHLFLFRRRGSLPPLPRSRQLQKPWIGAAYVLLSVVVFLYISGLAPTLL
jgi:hypothetical protein